PSRCLGRQRAGAASPRFRPEPRRIDGGKEFVTMTSSAGLAVRCSGLVACALVISGCKRQAPPSPLVRPVLTTVIRYGTTGEPVSLSGLVQAQNQTSLAFRIGGLQIHRLLLVYHTVSSDHLIACIRSQDATNTFRSS